MFARTTLTALCGAAVLVALVACSPALATPAGAPPGPAHGESSSVTADELGADDGFVEIGDSVALADDVPAITNLDPTLRDALERAADAATERGVEFTFTDAWRSERYQQYLFDRAVITYGSEEEAERWVKRPAESQHVLGKAVDVATADAMDWLTRFGAEFGLCQVYANESWHFEFVPGVTDTCPEQLADGSAG